MSGYDVGSTIVPDTGRRSAGHGLSRAHIRAAGPADLASVNAVVEAAAATWSVAERVKRLSIPLLRYSDIDVGDMDIVVAEKYDRIVGVAAWHESAASPPLPGRLLLLHGLYVDPAHHGGGIGSALVGVAQQQAGVSGLPAVLVKAQRDAVGFFRRNGFKSVPPGDAEGRYPYVLWKPVSPTWPTMSSE